MSCSALLSSLIELMLSAWPRLTVGRRQKGRDRLLEVVVRPVEWRLVQHMHKHKCCRLIFLGHGYFREYGLPVKVDMQPLLFVWIALCGYRAFSYIGVLNIKKVRYIRAMHSFSTKLIQLPTRQSFIWYPRFEESHKCRVLYMHSCMHCIMYQLKIYSDIHKYMATGQQCIATGSLLLTSSDHGSCIRPNYNL